MSNETEKKSTFIILVRTQKGLLLPISGEDEFSLAEFKSYIEADTLAQKHALCRACPYLILDIDL
jgi:hypothetical protein